MYPVPNSTGIYSVTSPAGDYDVRVYLLCCAELLQVYVIVQPVNDVMSANISVVCELFGCGVLGVVYWVWVFFVTANSQCAIHVYVVQCIYICTLPTL